MLFRSIGLFRHEQSAIKTMACEALVAAGMEVMARLTQVSTETQDETMVFWCKKAMKQIKQPRESMFYG